ncbi:MAG: tRNA (cytidine(34)-2'-O)-methyltransferase [Hyphomicrobiaceae bacterium]|nr:tRNA (cytidine(34)-2'-O)-methyltransferase [Hyphomicrobiaceae bacterium]
MRIGLYQPDIPQNTGTILRMAACLRVPVDVIMPTGFDLSDRALRRAALDYLAHAQIRRHADFAAFDAWRRGDGHRLVALSARAETRHVDFAFAPGDILLLGRESAGLPEAVHAAADARVRIPIAPPLRSLNIAVAAAIALGEALRQTGRFPSGA